MPQVTEFQLGLDTSALSGPSQAASVYSTGDSVAIGDPVEQTFEVPTIAKRTITVFANSINPVSYANADEVACFDIVFSVGIAEPDGSECKTYQVVKRIGLDKEKIAGEVKDTTPVTVVESSAQSSRVINEGRSRPSELERFRRIAGLG